MEIKIGTKKVNSKNVLYILYMFIYRMYPAVTSLVVIIKAVLILIFHFNLLKNKKCIKTYVNKKVDEWWLENTLHKQMNSPTKGRKKE